MSKTAGLPGRTGSPGLRCACGSRSWSGSHKAGTDGSRRAHSRRRGPRPQERGQGTPGGGGQAATARAAQQHARGKIGAGRCRHGVLLRKKGTPSPMTTGNSIPVRGGWRRCPPDKMAWVWNPGRFQAVKRRCGTGRAGSSRKFWHSTGRVTTATPDEPDFRPLTGDEGL